MLKLMVFDLDGTLVDSRRDLAESANELLATYGAAALSVDRVTAMVGEGARVLVERVLEARSIGEPPDAALARFLDIYARRVVDCTRAYPGVREALVALAGRVPLAVLTNKPGRHTGLLLEALDLRRFFTEVIGGDSAFPRKPDPSALRHLIGLAGATPETTLMVGDSIVDVDTARRAGCRMCVAQYGFGVVPPSAIASDTVVAQTSEGLLGTLTGLVAA